MKMFLKLLATLLLAGQSFAADVVELEVHKGIIGNALYSPGDDDAQPVLILHGFLQTYNFYTVKRLHDSLADAGYTVMSPTLSLGIDRRQQSLGCEAIHLHSMQDDVEELSQWVDWLHKRHGKPVMLLGHSAGGHVMTRYLHDFPQAPVGKGILVSLSYLRGDLIPPDRAEGMGTHSLGFCQKYPSTGEAVNSYIKWGAEQMLASMKGFRNPVAVILGSSDDRIEPSWRNTLKEGGVRIINIDGANHFFDSAHEFDLLEAVEELLDE